MNAITAQQQTTFLQVQWAGADASRSYVPPRGWGGGRGRGWRGVCELCVIIVLSSEAPMGALTKREHSPWWVTQQWAVRSRLWQKRLLCPSVLIVVNLPIAQSPLTFYCLHLFPQIRFFFFFFNVPLKQAVTVRLSFQDAGNVKYMLQLEERP